MRPEITADEIKYVELIQRIIEKKKVVIYSIIIFFSLGLLIAFTSHREYESYVITVSESEERNQLFGQLGGLAGMAGVNLPAEGQRQAFTPEIYPDILYTRSFLYPLVNEEFYFNALGRTMSLKEYYLEVRPGNIVSKAISAIINAPKRILSWVMGLGTDKTANQVSAEIGDSDQHIGKKYSSEDEFAISHLRQRIEIESNKRIITLRVKAPEPHIAAALNKIVLDRLIDFVTAYKTEKQRDNLEFVIERSQESEQALRQAQMNLASFRDANQGIISQKAKTREELLQAEFNIAFNVFNTLKQEEEQTKLQLKKETPVFTIIEPPVEPLSHSSPNVPLIMVLSLFLGLFFGVLLAVILVVKSLIINKSVNG